MDVTRGASLAGEHYATEGDLVRLTLGNFDYDNCGFKENTSKDNIYYTGDVNESFILNEGDVITPLTEQTPGLLGTTARIPESGKYIQSQDVALIKCNPDLLDQDFAYYLLPSKIVKEQLAARAQQTKIRHTSPDKIKDCTVFIPSVEDQKKIAAILRSIDDKIAMNSAICHRLEQTARYIYDYYFNNNQISHKEWTVNKFGDVIESINTGLNPRDNFVLADEGIRYITVKNLTPSCRIDFSGCDYIDSEAAKMIRKRSNVDAGDILFASIAPLGRCYLVQENPETWEINESVFAIKPNRKIVSSEYVYHYLTSDWFKTKAELESAGSIFLGIRVAALKELPITIPDQNTMTEYTAKAKACFSQLKLLTDEIELLMDNKAKILPLLMNGQCAIE